jgi:hypothetical protein
MDESSLQFEQCCKIRDNLNLYIASLLTLDNARSYIDLAFVFFHKF